ncbi:hypothetical protein L202_07462 [Cryptococcus amylolentus CBS 6039]|uniref:Yeast cell wall synthesis Kre9/Knh1-like N-terminal domain-containing protein n=2 Tax=Cryptococcus amylolentus TaxID=104669 RepID=A0A1E3HCB5_9TREE|nr:hypothetical protein L202_07462 [Cryptococcus amylolentus CBS 6039]ODN73964.1 hypothetical protein L202_07462 [Cryptococcus amylolentus CBS 6039]ODO00208.1 hypothetical protein I350_06834 [Cryptococcus amylolentus CBS 6273]
MRFATYVLAASAAVQSAMAGVYITSPVNSTAAIGGQVLEVKWADDGETPTVADIGPCDVSIYTGSVNNQVKLQNLAASVDVSKASSISATIDPSIGQDDSHYFVRFTSLSLKDSTNSQYYYEAFSSMFSIKSMTGSFNATVLAAIDASSSSSSAVSSSVKASSTVSGSVAADVASATKSSSTSSSTSTSTASSSAALTRVGGAPVALALTFVGAASYFIL